MSARRLLVVTTVPVEGGVLRERVRRHTGSEDAEVRVVVPAAEVSPLQWLTNEEDDARAEAEQVAERAGAAVEDEAGALETEVGDPDPVQAIEDALRTFPADELVVLTRSGEDANWLEKDAGAEAVERFGLPVTHLTV